MIGAPFLLAFIPLTYLGRARLTGAVWLLLLYVAVYAVIWFFALSLQTRFLLYVFPALAALTAAGAASLWSGTAGSPTLRAACIALCAGYVGLQSGYTANFLRLRLPAAFGMVTEEAYLDRMDGTVTHPRICPYLHAHLAPGARYLSLLSPLSYNCPMAAAITVRFDDELDAVYPPPPLTNGELADRLEAARVTLVAVSTQRRLNAGLIGTSEDRFVDLDLYGQRFGRLIGPLLPTLTPLLREPGAQVYAAADVVSALRREATLHQ
jgi:hypothetical protein